MTEAELQSQVVALAQMTGHLVMHARPARTAHGWSTPIEGDIGFPDLVICGRGRLLVAELKSAKGRLSADQSRWLAALASVDRAPETHVWRPDDWPAIEATLTRWRTP